MTYPASLSCHFSQLCPFLEPNTSQWKMLMSNSLCHILNLESILTNTNEIHGEFLSTFALVCSKPLIQPRYGCKNTKGQFTSFSICTAVYAYSYPVLSKYCYQKLIGDFCGIFFLGDLQKLPRCGPGQLAFGVPAWADGLQRPLPTSTILWSRERKKKIVLFLYVLEALSLHNRKVSMLASSCLYQSKLDFTM